VATGVNSNRVPEVHQCPCCGKPVSDDEDYITAREYTLLPGSIPSCSMTTAELAGSVVRRFHAGHFRECVGNRFYRRQAEKLPDPALTQSGAS
jgi:hypothetical protein